MNLTLELHTVAAGDLPDADLDVLIFDAESEEAQLGAFVGDGWVNAQGEAVDGVHTWAHMPSIRASVVEPTAWLHVYRQIGGGARYEEAAVGDSRHCKRGPTAVMTFADAQMVAAVGPPLEPTVMPRRALRCLDLFCGAGGAGMGLHRAGFEVVGVDINPQPYYPFTFRQGDALDADLEGFDLVWASPPCQAYTEMQRMHKNSAAHKDLVAPMRAKLQAWGGLWIMENVAGSPLRESLMLCGSMFGLRIAKHRFFEANFELPLLMPPCDHRDLYDPWHGPGRTADKMRAAQGTPWMPSSGGASRKRGETGDTNNAIPPAYSEFLGRHAMALLARHNVRANRPSGAAQE